MLNRIGKKLGYKEGGFTIIEVMIVLAVAGLIMAIVLVAIPQLQRSQRNSARKDTLGRIKTEIDSYSGNNNGTYPVASLASGASNFGTPTTALGFFARYLGCTAGPPVSCSISIVDPSTGEPVGYGSGTNPPTTVVGATAIGNTAGSIRYVTGEVCSGESTVAAGASSRNYAIQMKLEGGAIFCADNK